MLNIHWMTVRITLTLAAGLLAAACATTEPPDPLKKARSAYSDLAADPEALRYAPVELYEAADAAKRAEGVWARERDEVETEHLAYIADKRVEIARAVAKQAVAEEEASQLGERRTQVLLDAREAALAAREREIEALKELKARPTKRGAVITLGDVLFEFGGTELKRGAIRELDRLVAFLHEYSERALAIEGHTDSVGNESFNASLSRDRALAVKNILVRGGIDPRRITAQGLGEVYPVASNSTRSGRQRNRRVDLVIQSPTAPAKAQP